MDAAESQTIAKRTKSTILQPAPVAFATHTIKLYTSGFKDFESFYPNWMKSSM